MHSVRRRSAPTKTVRSAVLLILIPSVLLGYLGLRSITKQGDSLRTNYTATIVLVRDRVEAEVGRLEAEIGTRALGVATNPGSARDTQEWLASRAANDHWLADPFFVHANGGVITAAVSSGWPAEATGRPEATPAFTAQIRQADTAEFETGNLEDALRLYREARELTTAADGVCLVLSRIGRTLFKLERFEEGIERYREIVDLDTDLTNPNGIPYRVIALSQIADGLGQIGNVAEQDRTRRTLLDGLLAHPWDLERGYRYYLTSGLGALSAGETAARLGSLPTQESAGARRRLDLTKKSDAVTRSIVTAEWLRSEIGPRLQLELRIGQGDATRHGRLFPTRAGEPIHLRFDILPASSGSGGMTAFGYAVNPYSLASDLLPRVLESVDLGSDLSVVILDAQGDLQAGGDGSAVSRPLVHVEFQQIFPGWEVALFHGSGRSIEQLVARDNVVYGGLIITTIFVLLAGVVFTVRASAREAELARLKSEFVANVSHELKTPLSLIRMFGETLESGLVTADADRQEFYGIIRKESERLTHLINNVLDFGQISAGTKTYALVRGDIVAVVRDCLAAYRYFFERLGFEVDADLPSAPIHLPLNRDAIAQALVNLFHNAVTYGGDGKYVGVRVRVENRDVLLSVADRGVGIPANEIERIFEQYHRVGNGPSEQTAGSGLGLAIVKHAVEGHGGRVDVESTVGQGSVFTLRLPISDPERGSPG